MNAGQYGGILNLLVEIRDRMPEREVSKPEPFTVHHLNGTRTVYPAAETHSGNLGARQALAAMFRMLDSWIDGAKENHEAIGHRHENTGEECWRTFAPDDIRRMVNDVARELGLAEFPAPTTPEEDKAL